MNVHLYSVPDDVRVLCARFDLLLMLPVEDWFALFELAEKEKLSLPAYIVTVLKKHIHETGARTQVNVQEPA